jgi:hypothetical protein
VLPSDAKERKEFPLFSGLLKYFPDALAEVAHLSFVGNKQHNPGQPLHWDKSKSTDHEDCLLRHLLQSGTVDSDGVLHDVKVAWRALANAQIKLEAAKAKPVGQLTTICLQCGSASRGLRRLTLGNVCMDPWHN